MKKLLLSAFIISVAITARTQVAVISGGAGQTNQSPDNGCHGGAATGLGCGGGGANYYGGNGGEGKYGGGGGGAAGYTATNMVGGAGGQGVLVVAFYNGVTFLNAVVYKTGSSLIIDAGITSVKAWVIGAGGGGAGATNSDGTVGGGGGAGGTAYITAAVLPGDIISYSLGTAGAGGTDANNGNNGGITTAVVSGSTITGNGGAGGQYNNGTNAAGGSFSGGDGGSTGGAGRGIAGDEGGAGGGGIAGAIAAIPTGGNGSNGADAADVSGLFAALAAASILPVSWKSFTIKTQAGGILLQWTTAYEQNTKSFTVQHSGDGINFTDLVIIAAAGNSSSGMSYQYAHLLPAAGTNYYRLYQADKDGKNSYSAVKQLFYAKKLTDFVLLANPSINGTIQFQVKANTLLTLWSRDGRQVYSKGFQKGFNQINVSHLPKGNYIIQAGNETKKILIQ